MEFDIRTGASTNIDAIRFADNRVIKVVNGDFQVQNNTGEAQLTVPKGKINDFIAALQAAIKLLG